MGAKVRWTGSSAESDMRRNVCRNRWAIGRHTNAMKGRERYEPKVETRNTWRWLTAAMLNIISISLLAPQIYSEEISVRNTEREARVEKALQELQDADPLVRGAAARVLLGELGAKEYTANVVELLKDEDARVRVLAVEALADLGATEYVQEITKLLRDDDAWVRGAAHWALGQLGQGEKITGSVRPSIAMAASGMLGTQGKADAVRAVAKDLGSMNESYSYDQYAIQRAQLRGLLLSDKEAFQGREGVWRLVREGHQVGPGNALVIVFHQYDYHPNKGQFSRISLEFADGGAQGTYRLPSENVRGFVSYGNDRTSSGMYSETLSGTVEISERFVVVDLIGSMVGNNGSRNPAEPIHSAFVIGKTTFAKFSPKALEWLNQVSAEAPEEPKRR